MKAAGEQPRTESCALPNGNALVTNSYVGEMQEVDRSGAIVQSFTHAAPFGYVDFRTSLYGPPPR